MTRHTLIALACLLTALTTLSAQELNCRVSINHQQIQGTNTQVFETLERSISEFMNNRHWTRLNVQAKERIECTLLIVVNAMEDGVFTCDMTVQSRRPVYNTNYTTTMLNMRDRDFVFSYAEYDQLEYQEGYFTSNLAAMLSFYAYLILGYDADSFAPLGGQPYFSMCENVASAAQGASLTDGEMAGWKAFNSSTNRYAIANNLNDDAFRDLRNFFYSYHRLGLDMMQANADNGRARIAEGLPTLRAAYRARPSAGIVTLFADAKYTELVEIFKRGSSAEKQTAYDVLTAVDPTRSNEYDKLL